MKELMICEFIDDEMVLADKKVFIDLVANDHSYSREVLEMLDTEIMLQADIDISVPDIKITEKRKLNLSLISAVGFAALLLISILWPTQEHVLTTAAEQQNRFVIYAPNASSLHVAGTFTEWQKMKMYQVKGTGYWEVFLPVSSGEHRYNFIVDDSVEIIDPTAAETEQDGFGGKSSILLLEG